MTNDRDQRYDLHITGDVSGQVVVGSDNTVSNVTAGRDVKAVTEPEIAALRAEFARVKALLPADAPVAEPARERLDELEEAVTAPEPDLSTMEYVRTWFGKRLPALAGTVTGLIVHPVVGRLVEAAGEALSAEFRRRFGSDE
jgi:hypothetical protein